MIGSVRVLRLDERDRRARDAVRRPEAFGTGTGRALLTFAEQFYGTDFMQLELLVPRGAPHPHKVRLHEWYSRLGYREISRRNFDEPLLAGPADLRDLPQEPSGGACDLSAGAGADVDAEQQRGDAELTW